MCAQGVVLYNSRPCCRGPVVEAVAHLLVRITEQPQRLIGSAVERILVSHALQSRGRCRKAALVVVERSAAKLVVGQDFLDIAQLLLRVRSELAVGELSQQLPALVLGAIGV